MRFIQAGIVASLVGCGSGGHPFAGSDLGLTVGGVQDINYVRDVIEAGGVPQSGDLYVEGLLSQHALPAGGEPCEELVCLRPTAGRAPSLAEGDDDALWLFLGTSSGIATPYQRPPIDLVVLVDVSSSMGIDMEETAQAVVSVVEQLGPQDRLGVVAFDTEVDVLHDLGTVTDPAALVADLRALEAAGGWDPMKPMQQARRMHDEAGDDPQRLRRVIMLTCGYPGVHSEGQDSFSEAVVDLSEDRIGFGMYGVLLGHDTALADLLGQTRGGSFHYLQSLEQTATVFDTELDFMISPVAYDVDLSLTPTTGYAIDRVYGLPGEPDAAELQAATLFASNRGGGIVARIAETEAAQGPVMADTALSYDPETAHGFPTSTPQDLEVDTVPPGPQLPEAIEPTVVRKAALLVNQAERMKASMDAFHGSSRGEAVEILDELLAYMESEVDRYEEPALDAEVALVQQLRDNMR